MESYEKVRLVLMCRDPEWLFAYWEVSLKDQIKLSEAFKEGYLGNATWALRILSLEPENTSSKSFFVPLAYQERSKYIYLPSESRRYRVEYGLLGQDYSYHPLLFSNTISLPRKKSLLPGSPAYVMKRMNPAIDASTNTNKKPPWAFYTYLRDQEFAITTSWDAALTSTAESYYVKG